MESTLFKKKSVFFLYFFLTGMAKYHVSVFIFRLSQGYHYYWHSGSFKAPSIFIFCFQFFVFRYFIILFHQYVIIFWH